MINRKAALLEYKMSHRLMGVYQIRNTVTEKVWIDSSINVPAKFNRYRLQLAAGLHPSKALQADWDEFGESAFAFEILEHLEPQDDPSYDYTSDLKIMKEIWMEKVEPYADSGYNQRKKTT